MSGHSKWHNIKLRKGKQDAMRSRLFTKLAKEIIVAAKEGGGNPDANLRLRLSVQKARDNSMPQDNIKRAIQRGTGEIDGVSYDEVMYEGYGTCGIAILVKCLTDNRNRTVAEIRNIFTKLGGNLGESGCVGWMFDAKGMIQVPASKSDEESVMMATMDAGAEDIKVEDEYIEVYTPLDSLAAVRDALTDAGIPFDSAEMTFIPQTTISITDAKDAGKVLRMIDMLDENEDVQQVYSNFDIPEEILNELE